MLKLSGTVAGEGGSSMSRRREKFMPGGYLSPLSRVVLHVLLPIFNRYLLMNGLVSYSYLGRDGDSLEWTLMDKNSATLVITSGPSMAELTQQKS
jgi:hypothetical protein